MTLQSLCQTVYIKGEFCMGGDTAGAKPSVHFTDWLGICISEGLFVCKSMETAFRTEQSVRIIIDGWISRLSASRGSTVVVLLYKVHPTSSLISNTISECTRMYPAHMCRSKVISLSVCCHHKNRQISTSRHLSNS